MDQLRSFTLANLYKKEFLDEDAFILWLQELGSAHKMTLETRARKYKIIKNRGGT